MQQSIKAQNVFTGEQHLQYQELIIENGRVQSILPISEDADYDVWGISPAFFDTHINGGEHLYFTQYPTAATLKDMDEACQKYGTGYLLPCLITSSMENILEGIETVRAYKEANPTSGIVGMHLEGPFLNPLKRGAHLARYIRTPNDEELATIIHHGKDVIKLMTIAPEVFSEAQIQMLLDSGITISAGHSNATHQEAEKAFQQGIPLVTHLFNAMSAMGHREAGLVGATLANDNVYAPIILDGFHCDYTAAKVAYKAKKDKLFLISDALFLGNQVTHFQWEEFDATLSEGQYRNSEGNLAGAAISLGDAVKNAINLLGISLQEAIEMATIRPAKAVNMDSHLGKIAPNYPASFTVFDEELNFSCLKME